MLTLNKVGHAGTLDVEAEGVLPIAIGEATKLVNILVTAKKQYAFTIQFGISTDTADRAGKTINTTHNIPSESQCHNVCNTFIGTITQIPPVYSALKIQGKRSYKMAREGKEIKLTPRVVTIFNLKCIHYNTITKRASYICDCSKGTYIRTLAEDIALSLQSLGFVLELRRLKVGLFTVNNALNLTTLTSNSCQEVKQIFYNRYLKIEAVLDDIPVLDATHGQVQAIRFGQRCYFDTNQDYSTTWVRNSNKIIAIGSMYQNIFKSSRVFNI